MLASEIKLLSETSKVIQTKENALELWASNGLLLAFDLRSGSPTLLHSGGGTFTFESIVWAMNSGKQGQGLSTALLTVNLKECQAEEQKQEQKQEQGKQEQDKQDQGKKFVADFGGAEEQGQGKEEGKPAQLCKAVAMEFQLKEVEQSKEQDQGKPADQGKDQGKPVDQGKDQDKPVDQGKDQDKPADQGKDQDKPADQGKK
jgi:hypothetical protein